MPLSSEPYLLKISYLFEAIRIIFGLYSESFVSTRQKRLVKQIICFTNGCIILCIYKTATTTAPFYENWMRIVHLSVNYISAYVFAKNNMKYFHSVLSRIDSVIPKQFVVKIILSLFCFSILLFILNFMNILNVCFDYPLWCRETLPGLMMYFVVYEVIIDLGSFHKFAFVLTFCDIKALELKIRRFGFHDHRYTKNIDYVEIYTNIFKSFKKLKGTLSILIIPNYNVFLLKQFISLKLIIERVHKYNFINIPNISEIIKMIQMQISMLLPVIFLELVAETQDKIRIYILNQRVACLDNRKRLKMLRLLARMRRSPLRYSLCGAVPFNASFAFGLLSFCASYVIAVLQLSHVLNQ